MATVSNTPRPGYVWDATDNVWYPIGVGGHGHPDYITQATAVNPTVIDAKGDILTATAADTPARLAVGNNGETLVADSSTATGLKWAAASSGALTKITSATFTAVSDTSTTFDGVFTNTYNNYLIEISPVRGSVSSAALNFQLRKAGPTTQTSAYNGNRLTNATVTTTSSGSTFTLLNLETEDAGITMNFYRQGTPTSWTYAGFQRPSVQTVTGACMNDSVGSNVATGFILTPGSGTITGTVAVYGLAD
jgi:hypothetical protein